MKKENKKINKYDVNITIEYGKQDLKNILLEQFEKEYIKTAKNNIDKLYKYDK